MKDECSFSALYKIPVHVVFLSLTEMTLAVMEGKHANVTQNITVIENAIGKICKKTKAV